MVYVYAKTQRAGDEWARGQGLRPRDFRAFGTYSRATEGLRFVPGDRIVVLGEIGHQHNAVLERNWTKAAGVAPIERLALADS